MSFPLPKNEPARLEALRSFKLLDTPPEEPYERLVAVAQRLLDAPMAAFCLLDETRQWSKASAGMEMAEMRRDLAFCNYTVAEGKPVIVSDTTRDARFADHPYVVDAPGLRAYAGVPVRAPDGEAIGTLIVLDTIARRFTPQEQANLRMLAERLEEHIELRRLALQTDDHRQRTPGDAGRVERLVDLWKTSGELMLQELEQLEDMATQTSARLDASDTTTFGDAVERVGALFDMAKEMMVHFRDLGMKGDGSFELQCEIFEPKALSASLFERFSRRFDKQGRELLLEDSTGDFELRGDLGVLRRVLEELVENAVAYSPVSTDVRIEFKADGDWLTVRVFDRGPGPNKRLEDEVYDEGMTRQTLIDSGSPGPRRGDGLSYVRGAVEAHGGIVGYDHCEPTGCVFWFCVPSNPLGLPIEH